MLAARLDAARLISLHRGVYAVGHRRLTREGEWLAAVLAAGDGAVLSHRSAAALHGLREERGGRVDVSTPAKCATTNWIEPFSRRKLLQADFTFVRRLPVTTIARTLVDLGEVLRQQQLARRQRSGRSCRARSRRDRRDPGAAARPPRRLIGAAAAGAGGTPWPGAPALGAGAAVQGAARRRRAAARGAQRARRRLGGRRALAGGAVGGGAGQRLPRHARGAPEGRAQGRGAARGRLYGRALPLARRRRRALPYCREPPQRPRGAEARPIPAGSATTTR